MSFLDSFVPGLVKTLSETSFLGVESKAKVSVSAGYNYETGSDVESTVTEDLICFPPMDYAHNKIDGTNVMRGDMMLIIPAERWEALSDSFGDEPTTSMTIEIRNTKYSIENSKPYSTGELDAAFEVQLRAV